MNIQRHDDMMQSYGFGLPQPIAEYLPARVADWHVQKRANSFAPGYIARHVVDDWHHVLFRDDKPWMTTALMELESHAWHFERARGTVVVGGMGMGMFANAIAAKPEVERVIIVEIDQDVIDVAMASGQFQASDYWRKVEIIKGDILGLPALNELRRRAPSVDYLYMDIWPDYPNAAAPGETQVVSEHLGNPESGWWCQELEFVFRSFEQQTEINAENLMAFSRDCGVKIEVTDGYLRMIEDVAQAHDVVSSPDLDPDPALGMI